jgi:hypothetical protein
MPVLQNLSPVYRHWEIARLIRAGLDTCISPRLLINTESLFLQPGSARARAIIGPLTDGVDDASNDTASDLLPFDEIHIPRSDHLLQARHRDTSLCGCLHLTKDELGCRQPSAWITGHMIGNLQHQLCLDVDQQTLLCH